MRLLCYLTGCKYLEWTFKEHSVLICERCGKAIL